ncbi:hypothetical protein ACRFGM_02280 [Klebsiella pneumoniae]|nr:hypothetical protein [Klebsiella pneumoniae]MCY0552200.1 hypothetical protein [Klebsiella pneumoniae]MDG0514878.1 hypothetical protein [Klebsiella pneumoniae]MDM8062834.1 hypothetical protein [Klebsiella pneumoniae]MDM8097149.1 hypothetical protein [Klebsiella pneumoniae]MDP1302488.1 hypothetical protein [Klebsiella pneumoniae]
MIKRMKVFWDENAVYILPIAGIVCLAIGQILLAFGYIERFANILTNTGIALLGGALFTAITKTTHYTKFFQDRIFDVFYNPEKGALIESIKTKWQTLTHYLLLRTAGDLREDVAKELLKRFFDSDIPYYFPEITESYDMVLLEDNKTLITKKKVTCRLVINSSRDEATLTQKITAQSKHELKAIYVDHQIYDITDNIVEKDIIKDGINQKYLEISIKLKNNGKPIVIERFYEKEQDLCNDPWTIVNNSKFIQQLVVKYKASNCKVLITPTGTITSPENNLNTYIDQDGYTRIVLSPPGGLTLPGEGYILLVQPESKECAND